MLHAGGSGKAALAAKAQGMWTRPPSVGANVFCATPDKLPSIEALSARLPGGQTQAVLESHI